MAHTDPPLPALRLAPSLLASDFARLGEEIRAVEAGGADWLHLDVMDGHFVPNLTFGPPVIASLRKVSRLPFDVHLMIEAPERSVEQYVQAGADQVTVHVETSPHLHRTLAQIRTLGARAGVSVNPGTPLSSIEAVLHAVDLVLIMTVNPGFGGQSFLPEVLAKLRALADLKAARGLRLDIAVDGGIGPDTIAAVCANGANVCIAGSAIFGQPDYGAAMRSLRAAAST